MGWLISGVLVWAVVHLSPALAPRLRERLDRDKAFRGLFALGVFAGLALVIVGWRSAVPQPAYAPPAWGATLAWPLMFAAVWLFGASHAKGSVARRLRHPQLIAVLLWSVAHLLANGDTRSLVLFGGLGVWALLEIPLLNRRDRDWRPQPSRAAARELLGLVIAGVLFAALVYLHPWFAGARLLPAG